jgi:hypothetical protein
VVHDDLETAAVELVNRGGEDHRAGPKNRDRQILPLG